MKQKASSHGVPEACRAQAPAPSQLPVRPQVEAGFLDDYPQAQLRKIAGKIDVPVLDLLPPLREMWMKSREPLFYDQCHYTEYGNEAVAGLILAFLRENRLLGEVQDRSGADAQLPAGDPARRNAAEGK